MKTKVYDYILSSLEKHKLHMTLIDPASQDIAKAGRIAAIANRLGTHAFMVGGSTGVTQENLEGTIAAIKKNAPGKPVIHFPTGANVLSPSVDAIYFMSFLNSRNTKMVIGEQAAGAPIIKKIGIETIPMGYVVIEPGMKVGQVGDAKLVKRDEIDVAVGYALAAEFLGMKLVYLEAGSGADEHVPADMIWAVSEAVSIPVIVGGGIRDGKKAKVVADAGADILVTGTLVEEANFEKRLVEIIGALR